MQSIQQILESALADAVSHTLGPEYLGAAQVRPCAELHFGDYQCSNLIALAKKNGKDACVIAQKIATALALPLQNVCETPEVAGAGYINFRLKTSFVLTHLTAALHDSRHGVPAVEHPLTIAVDFSSPNIAKPLHVGHIRSTILGDAISRMLRFLGHHVITDNHLGDWGTQFGFLIVGWKQFRDDQALETHPLAECERLYQLVYRKAQQEPGLLKEARAELAKLQAGDAENLAIWRRIGAISTADFETTYKRLGVQFDHSHGESFYSPLLPTLVQTLRQRGLAQESDGAICTFFDDPGLKERPMLIQKQDGAFLYATTDLATLQYRIENWRPQEILYVTDARQQLHFRQLFAAARKWGILTDTHTRLRHIQFGSILGEDGKPLKTREGDPVKLTDLLDEAERRAWTIVQTKNPELSDDDKRNIARVVGLGALKYADLSQNRVGDYIFSWDKMLAMMGNTAPYLQYAYVRICSIFRKAQQPSQEKEEGTSSLPESGCQWSEPAEIDLAKHLLRFPETIRLVLEDYHPHFLCIYLYELATRFSAFYDACPVLRASEPARKSRLALCHLTAAILKKGLDLLGIESIERM